MTFTSRSLSTVVMVLGVTFLASPVRPSSITINDTLANNTVQVTYNDLNFTMVSFTANCIPTAGSTTTVGSVNCTEPSMSFTVDDNSTFGLGNHIIEVNFFEADGVTLSDTLFATATDTTACPTCTPTVHAVLTFASGPGLTPFSGGTGIDLLSVREGSLSGVLGTNQTDPITLTAITATPEPASLILVGIGVAGFVFNQRRKRRAL